MGHDAVTLPPALVDAAREGDLVPLVGSGPSMAAGMASWDRVVEVLRSHIPKYDSSDVSLDLLETPDAVRRYLPREQYRRILSEAFGDSYSPTRQHQLLASLPLRTVLTTNFDNLLEREFRNVARVNVIATDEEAHRWRETEGVQIVKFHGTVDRPDTLVFGERDYSRVYGSSGLMMSIVRTLMSTRPVLFVGFGFRDVFVKSILSAVRASSGVDVHDHYVLVLNGDKRARYYEDLGLIPVSYASTSSDPFGVTSFLEDLSAEASLEARTRLARTELLVRETERLRNYLGPNRVLRVRAALGPLTVPPGLTKGLDLFGDSEVHSMESRIGRSVVEFIEKGRGSIRLICNPLDNGGHAKSKGYTIDAYRTRLATFIRYIEQYPRSIEVATLPRASDINEWIAADKAVIESQKGADQDGRLYSYGRVELSRSVVNHAIQRFDEDFRVLTQHIGGSAGSTARFVETARSLLH